MRNALLILILLISASDFAAAQSGTAAPTIEQVEAQIKQAEQAAAEKARQVNAARQAEINRQAQIKRDAAAVTEREQAAKRAQQQAAKVLADAAAAEAAKKATLVIKTDTTCQLSINGEDRGTLEAQVTQRLPVDPGEQLIECVGAETRVEQTATVEGGRQAVVQLALPPPAQPERFERVTEGVKDNEQNLIWAERDNGSDINWTNATQYCASLGSGWTLPSSVALQSMYDASGKNTVPLNYNGTNYSIKVATSLINFTGGGYWTSEQNGSSEAWNVLLVNGTRNSYPVDFTTGTRALCVRRS